MHPKLEEIDQLYRQHVEWYMEPDFSDLLFQMESFQKRYENEEEKEKTMQFYNQGINLVNELVPTLSPEEIIEGFLHAGKLLHRNLSGYMSADEYFDEKYIPVMVQAIKDDDTQPLYGFLLKLSRILDKHEVFNLVSIGLESQNHTMIMTACAIAERNNYIKLVPKIQSLLTDERIPVANAAKSALENLTAI